jgi:hypothetical protein
LHRRSHPHKTSESSFATSANVKGCRTPAVDGWLRRLASAGRCRTSLRGGNRGGIRRGGGAGAAYGDLTAAGRLWRVARSVGWRGCGQRRYRGGAFLTTWRCCSMVSFADPRACGGIGQSGAVAGGGRHP